MKRRFSFNKRIAAGLVIGILIPLICIPVVIAILAWAQNFPYMRLWNKMLIDSVVQSKVVSLSIIPNLAAFYFFLNRERYDIARGVIVGSACYLPYILYVNFF